MLIFEDGVNTLKRKNWEEIERIWGKIPKKHKQEKVLWKLMRILFFSEEGKSQWMNVRRSGIQSWVHPWRAVWPWMERDPHLWNGIRGAAQCLREGLWGPREYKVQLWDIFIISILVKVPADPFDCAR